MTPSVSVIIPVYNRADLLQKTLRSVYAQTVLPKEVIVVDDGSTEDIETAVKKVVPPEEVSVHVLRQNNQGAPAARNAGFEVSSGQLVIFWDADIIGRPHMLEWLIGALQQHPKAAYAYGDFLIGKKCMHAGDFDPQLLRERNTIATTSLIRREDFPGFDTTLNRFQDWDLWLRLLKKGRRGVYVPRILWQTSGGGTMSSWLPRCAYWPPFRWLPGIASRVRSYEEARAIIALKHDIS